MTQTRTNQIKWGQPAKLQSYKGEIIGIVNNKIVKKSFGQEGIVIYLCNRELLNVELKFALNRFYKYEGKKLTLGDIIILDNKLCGIYIDDHKTKETKYYLASYKGLGEVSKLILLGSMDNRGPIIPPLAGLKRSQRLKGKFSINTFTYYLSEDGKKLLAMYMVSPSDNSSYYNYKAILVGRDVEIISEQSVKYPVNTVQDVMVTDDGKLIILSYDYDFSKEYAYEYLNTGIVKYVHINRKFFVNVYDSMNGIHYKREIEIEDRFVDEVKVKILNGAFLVYGLSSITENEAATGYFLINFELEDGSVNFVTLNDFEQGLIGKYARRNKIKRFRNDIILQELLVKDNGEMVFFGEKLWYEKSEDEPNSNFYKSYYEDILVMNFDLSGEADYFGIIKKIQYQKEIGTRSFAAYCINNQVKIVYNIIESDESSVGFETDNAYEKAMKNIITVRVNMDGSNKEIIYDRSKNVGRRVPRIEYASVYEGQLYFQSLLDLYTSKSRFSIGRVNR